MRRFSVGLAVSVGAFLAVLAPAVQTQNAGPAPADVRAAAVQAGLASLSTVPVPEVPNLAEFLNVDSTGKVSPAARTAAVILGKALFWDMQVGSDRQACGSCHFHSGADDRAKNQLSPGLRANPADTTFGNPARGTIGHPEFGPNYRLTGADFPFHELAIPDQNNFGLRQVVRDTNDVTSSQGVFNANFTALSGGATDQGTRVADPVFNVLGVNTRRVEPRNTPTMINAVFNFDNFWDGRARNQFNGVSPLGLLDTQATILINDSAVCASMSKSTPCELAVSIPNSSLASQAVGPPLSDFEMSFAKRTFASVGKKMLGLTPLGIQRVHSNDSVLGPFSRASQGLNGLNVTYADLIKAAFQSRYWSSTNVITFDANGNRVIWNSSDDATGETFTQMQANFSLFFGLAVQLYETTLISDRTRFDRFMSGNDLALSPAQLKGLLIFINTGSPEQQANPIFQGVSQGNCVSCHSGPEFTGAAFTSLTETGQLELIDLEQTAVLNGGFLALSPATGFEDNGFSNIGVRPTREDLGRGGTELGKPLSFVRQAIAGFPFAPDLPACGAPNPSCPQGLPTSPRTLVDGAFKVPGLRNVELTGPYFHNGGNATLQQVIEFYDRQGDFGNANIQSLDSEMVNVNIGEGDEEPLVRFLLALTDERVRNESAPFDRPEIRVPNGHPGNQNTITCFTNADGVSQACDDRLVIRAVGRGGRSAEGLPPLGTFLGLPPLQSQRPGLVLALAFDEMSGLTAFDSSPSSSHASISGASWTAGKSGGGLQFDGINDMLTVADATSLDLTRMTLEAWVKPATVSGWRSLLVKEIGAGTTGDLVYALYANSDTVGGPGTFISANNFKHTDVGPTRLSVGQWAHVAATYDGTVLRLYVNGIQVAWFGVTGSIASSTSPLRIGGNTIWGEFFAGVMDDVRVYDRALTQADIQTDMNTPVQ